MAPRITIDDYTLQQLQQVGELKVEDTHGVPLVIMTVDARQDLQKLVYDDSELMEAELMAAGADQVSDPEGWGAKGMDVYDAMEGESPTESGRS
jgi:hypothetical protein